MNVMKVMKVMKVMNVMKGYIIIIIIIILIITILILIITSSLSSLPAIPGLGFDWSQSKPGPRSDAQSNLALALRARLFLWTSAFRSVVGRLQLAEGQEGEYSGGGT